MRYFFTERTQFRSIYFALLIISTKIKNEEYAKLVFAFAKQLSRARLVARQLNHLGNLKAVTRIPRDVRKARDPLDVALLSAVAATYAVQTPVESVGWLADAKALRLDSAKWFRWSHYLWLVAMTIGIIRLLRRIVYVEVARDRRRHHRECAFEPLKDCKLQARAADRIALVGLSADFIAGIASLPHRILWAGRFTSRTQSTLSLVASLVGFYKCF